MLINTRSINTSSLSYAEKIIPNEDKLNFWNSSMICFSLSMKNLSAKLCAVTKPMWLSLLYLPEYNISVYFNVFVFIASLYNKRICTMCEIYPTRFFPVHSIFHFHWMSPQVMQTLQILLLLSCLYAYETVNNQVDYFSIPCCFSQCKLLPITALR